MNKYINKIFFASVLVLTGMLGLSSCTDYLDKSPNSDIAEADLYKSYKNFQGFVEELYSCIPTVSNNEYHTPFNFGEDDFWEPQEVRLFARSVDYGDFWGWTTCYYSYPTTRTSRSANLWDRSWYAIRKANIGIANLDKLVNATTEERQLLEGQLYFFRAWFHFMLMEWWGGMPYIDEVIPSNVTPTFPRLTWQACAERCVEDFDRAIPLLPVDWDQTTVGLTTLGRNNARANKIMALAYKGKALLWAGSPLMNWNAGGAKEYNAALCKRAADAFGEALKITEETGRYKLAPMESYNDIFLVHNSNGKLNGLNEAIFRENLADYGSRWRWNMVNDFRPQTIESSGIKCYPTANYVNYFGMQNGYPIKDLTKADAESGYDPAYPWKNRDPRFYKDIMFDGVKWQSTGGAGGSSELFTNGRESEEKNEKKGCFTGYMNSKLCPQLMNTVDGYKENNIMVLSLMRLADVYLMYSEATAVGYGVKSKATAYTKTAEEAINVIRQRAGVENVLDRFTGTTADFLGEVQRERAVELAFEGFRFMDLRRWMLIGQSPYNKKTKIEFDRGVSASDYNYDKPEENMIRNLREEVLVERKYTDRHYWLPLPKNDVYLYEGFGQNPGW